MNDFPDKILDALRRSDPVLGGVGIAVGVSLVLALLLLLPREQRKRARAPLWLLVGNLALSAVMTWVPEKSGLERLLQLVGVFLILASIGRSAFVLFVDAFFYRRFARPVPQILRDVIQAFVFVGIGLIVLRSAGVEPGSLLTTSALLTAVIGLSLQDTLGNLFAGLAIQAQRPFDVGDWIQFDQQTTHIGKVMEINWRATRVLTLERVEITVPNNVVAKAPILNYSRPTNVVRRSVEIVAPYSASPEYARSVFMAALDHVPNVLSRPEPRVLTRDYTDRGIVYDVRYFIDAFDDREIIESDVRDRLWYALKRRGLRVPVPHREVELSRPSRERTEGTLREKAATQLLSQLEFFKELPPDQAASLAKLCRRESFASEELIVKRGQLGTEMYLIERGAVRIEAAGPNGSTRTVAELRRGDFFGEMSLMTGEARAADVVASEETSVLVLDRQALAPILEVNPNLAGHISRVLADRRSLLLKLEGAMEETQPEEREDELLARIRRFFSL